MDLLQDEGWAARLQALLVDDELPDMTGLALLAQVGPRIPHVVRVLLHDDPFLPYEPDQLAELALDDVWLHPRSGRRLAKHLVRSLPWLRRTRAVHRRLDEQACEMEALVARHYHARLARDRLAKNVENALLADEDCRFGMLWWWQGYRQMLQLRVGLFRVRTERLRLVDIVTTALQRPELERWAFPRGLPPEQKVWLDAGLVNRTTRCLLRGMLEAGDTNARVRWGRFRAQDGMTTIQLHVEPVRPEVRDLEELLEDPFARLPDGPLRDLSIDLPLANELLQAQGGRLDGVLTPPALMVEWKMARSQPTLPEPFVAPIRPIGRP